MKGKIVWVAEMCRPYDGGCFAVAKTREAAEKIAAQRYPIMQKEKNCTFFYYTEQAKIDMVAAVRVQPFEVVR